MENTIVGPNERAKDSGQRLISTMGVNSDGHLNVDTYHQDQSTDAVIVYFNQVTNSTTLSAAIALNDRIIPVVSATGISVGSYIILFDPISTRFSTAFVTAVNTLNITLDSPMDFEYPAGTFIDVAIVDMSVDGSGTPQVFGLRGTGAPPGVNITFHLTRIIFQCTTASAVSLALFADITALTNGLLFRSRNGRVKNIFNVKSNAEIDGVTLDWKPYSALNPQQGQHGFTARLTFNGEDKMGIVLELPIGEDAEFWVQDALQAITSFRVIAEGHIVEDLGA